MLRFRSNLLLKIPGIKDVEIKTCGSHLQFKKNFQNKNFPNYVTNGKSHRKEGVLANNITIYQRNMQWATSYFLMQS